MIKKMKKKKKTEFEVLQNIFEVLSDFENNLL